MLDEVIAHGSDKQCQLLAKLLEAREASVDVLRARLQSKSTTLWQKITDQQCSYSRLLFEVAQTQGMRPVLLESSRDLELRLIRTLYKKSEKSLSSSEKRNLELQGSQSSDTRSFWSEGFGASSIVAAQMSGFGVFQMATTVLGAASAGAGVTVPFTCYMALTKGISILIGPVGWSILGASFLHKVTKPKWASLLGVVAWMCAVRQQAFPRKLFWGYSATEIARKAAKAALPTMIIVGVLCSVSMPRSSVSTISQAADISQELPKSFSAVTEAPPRISPQTIPPDENKIVPLESQEQEVQADAAGYSVTEDSASAEQPVSSLTNEAEEEEIQDALKVWREGVLTNIADRQITSYAPELDRYFLLVPASRDQVMLSLRRDETEGVKNLSVDVSDLKIVPSNDHTYVLSFNEHYNVQRKGLHELGDVRTEMRFALIEQRWLITYLRQFRLSAPIDRY